MSTGEIVFVSTVVFFALLAVLVFLRLLFRKGPPHWTQLRLGVYIERVPDEQEWPDPAEAPTQVLPPTTYQKP